MLDVLLHGQREQAESCADAASTVVEGDVRDGAARGQALDGRRRRRPPGRDRRRSRVRARPAARAGGQRRRRQGARRRDAAEAGRRALRDGVDVLELRPHGRPDGRRSTRPASWRPCRSTPSRRWRSSSICSACDPAPFAVTCLRFATVYGVAPAHALRPHGQRVHARPLGRPQARGLRRAVLAPVRPRARRRARHPAGPRGAGRDGRRPGLQRRRLGRELPQARPRRADPQADRPRRGRLRPAHEDPRDYKVSFEKIRDDARLRGHDDRVRDGIAEILDAPSTPTASTTPSMRATETFPEIPLFDLRLEPEDVEAVAGRAALGLADDGPADGGVRARVRRRTSGPARRGASRAARRRCTWPTWPRASGPATR